MVEIIKEVEFENATIVFIKQENKPTKNGMNNLYKTIANLLLAEKK